MAARANRFPGRLLAVALSGFVVAECSLIKPDSSSPSAWRARLEAVEARLPEKLPAAAVLAIAAPPQSDDDDGWQTQMDAELARLIQRIAGIQKRVLYKPLSSRHELASRLSRSPARRESRHVRPLWLSRRAPVQLSDRSSQEGRGGVRRRTDHLGRRRHAARRGGAATRDRGYTCAADLGPA